ncbi:MAG: hypothetical protein D6681_03970, partial [Calditrichaeota bacterium]
MGVARSGFTFFVGAMLWMQFFAVGAMAEIVSYSERETERVEQFQNQMLTEQIPHRRWLLLTRDWEIKSPDGAVLHRINIPCAFRDEPVILLEKSFPLQTHPDEVYFLHFGQINGAVTISLNDVVIYEGEHNYLPLTLALTPEQMSKGTNILRVELRPDARTSRSIPGFQPVNLPRVDSGLLQPVYLEICPAFFVEDIQLHFTDYDSLIHLEGQVTLNRMLPPTRDYRVIISVQSPEQTIYREIFSPEKEPFR